MRIGIDGTAETLLSKGTDAQLEWVNPSRYEALERCDATIFVDAPGNTRALAGVDPERQARAGRGLGPLPDPALSKASGAGNGSPARGKRTSRTARSSRAPSRRASQGRSASRSRR